MEHNKLNENIEKLARHFEKTNFAEYVELWQKPWKMLLLNFLSGLFRGLGIAIGMTVVFGIVIFVVIKLLANLINVPIIGIYIAQLIEFVNLTLKSGIKP